MISLRKVYDPAFKSAAVKRVEALRPSLVSDAAAYRAIAADMNLSAATLRAWVVAARKAPVEEPAEPVTLEQTFDTAVGAMDWLEKSDLALVALGRVYAKQIDDILADPYVDAQTKTKTLYLGPHLINALRELGGSPGARKELTRGGESVGGKLKALRGIEGGRATGT